MKYQYTLCVALIINCIVQAQSTTPDVIITSGNVIEGDQAILSWTIGENMVESFGEDELMLLQGFQEMEDSPVSIIEFSRENNFLWVYPTTTEKLVFVVFGQEITPDFTAVIYDMLGKACQTYSLNTHLNILDISELPYGTYLLTIRDKEDIPVQNNKIIKK